MFELPRTNSWTLGEIPEMPQDDRDFSLASGSVKKNNTNCAVVWPGWWWAQADRDFPWASLSVEKKEKQMRGCLVGLAVDACCQGCLLGFRVG